MLNWDSENETWSALCKNLWYELYPTLGSVVPLAMFSPNFLHIKITGCPKKVATRICEKLFWPIELYVLRQTNSIVVLLERKSTKATILWYMSPGHKLNKYFFLTPCIRTYISSPSHWGCSPLDLEVFQGHFLWEELWSRLCLRQHQSQHTCSLKGLHKRNLKRNPHSTSTCQNFEPLFVHFLQGVSQTPQTYEDKFQKKKTPPLSLI